MPEQATIFELITNAGIVVQVVMGMLVLASLVSWMMIFQKAILLNRAQRDLDRFEDHFWSGIDLRELYQNLEENSSLNGIENLFYSGFREYTRLAEQAGADPDAIMQGV